MNTQSQHIDSIEGGVKGNVERPVEGSLISATYQVAGMTCGHCERAVIAEVGQVPGVTNVRVDLASGSVRVLSDRPVDRGAISAAFDEAGYTLL